MYGRKIYEFAITNVPKALKSCLDKSGVSILNVKKILIHQANEKMDEAIVKRFYKLFKHIKISATISNRLGSLFQKRCLCENLI